MYHSRSSCMHVCMYDAFNVWHTCISILKHFIYAINFMDITHKRANKHKSISWIDIECLYYCFLDLFLFPSENVLCFSHCDISEHCECDSGSGSGSDSIPFKQYTNTNTVKYDLCVCTYRVEMCVCVLFVGAAATVVAAIIFGVFSDVPTIVAHCFSTFACSM